MKWLLVFVLLSACANDKIAHSIAGIGISSYVYERTGSRTKACLASIGAGLAKEYYDSRTGGTVEAMDVVASGFGCAVTFTF